MLNVIFVSKFLNIFILKRTNSQPNKQVIKMYNVYIISYRSPNDRHFNNYFDSHTFFSFVTLQNTVKAILSFQHTALNTFLHFVFDEKSLDLVQLSVKVQIVMNFKNDFEFCQILCFCQKFSLRRLLSQSKEIPVIWAK